MAWLVVLGEIPIVIGSRIPGKGALAGGVAVWKSVANRGLPFIESVLLNVQLSESHSGWHAFSREVLETRPLEECSENFLFDDQMLAPCVSLVVASRPPSPAPAVPSAAVRAITAGSQGAVPAPVGRSV